MTDKPIAIVAIIDASLEHRDGLSREIEKFGKTPESRFLFETIPCVSVNEFFQHSVDNLGKSCIDGADAIILELGLEYKRGSLTVSQDGATYIRHFILANSPIIIHSAQDERLDDCLLKGAFYAVSKNGAECRKDLLHRLKDTVEARRDVLQISEEHLRRLLDERFEMYSIVPEDPVRIAFLAALYKTASTYSKNPETMTEGHRLLDEYLEKYNKMLREALSQPLRRT